LELKTYKLPLPLMTNICVIIPAFNEENAVGKVLNDIPKHLSAGLCEVTEIVVVNNNSNDQTAAVAAATGATVLDERKQGYGAACLKGIEYFKNKTNKPDIIVFIDADYSDFPEEMELLVKPILENDADMVIGSRALGKRQKGSMTFPQIFGNWLATNLIYLFYKVRFTDLGPFRAIKWESLLQLNMIDKTYGWTVEMQVKAAKQNLKSVEIPVNYRTRVGFSKISGTIKGTVLAGYKIITTIFKYI
jgi:glycosyltransferase involved in cell wall biosynthesis